MILVSSRARVVFYIFVLISSIDRCWRRLNYSVALGDEANWDFVNNYYPLVSTPTFCARWFSQDNCSTSGFAIFFIILTYHESRLIYCSISLFRRTRAVKED